MKKSESIHQKISKNSKRKESIASSKSDVYSKSESESDNGYFVQIKKEVSNTIILDKKIYDKLIQYIQNNNTFIEKTKNNYNKVKDKQELVKSSINEFSIISSKPNTNEKAQKTEENKNEKSNNDNVNEKKNIINNVNNNEIKVNPHTSMMSLFMNSQKGKEKEKEEISKLKSVIADITKRNETEINNYKEIIKELSSKIESLQKEINNLNE